MSIFSDIGSALTKASDQMFDIGMNIWDNYNSRKAAKKQYNYQMAFWQANNDYNSPKSQMQRLEESGLNPNLVYGNGAATHQASMATAPSVNFKASRSSKIMANYLAVSQLENMEAQNQNLHDQNLLLAAQRAKIAAEIDAIRAGIPKIRAESQVAAKRGHIANDYGVTSDYMSDVFGLGDATIDKFFTIMPYISGLASDFYSGAKDLARSWKPKSFRRKR